MAHVKNVAFGMFWKENRTMDEDEIKGEARKLAGQAEEALGAATSNESLEAQGQAHQAEGGARKLYGAAKDAADSAASAAGAAFGTVRDSVSGQWSQGADGNIAGDGYDDDGVMAQAAGFVRERPALAMLGAVAAGYALAFLLHGGRR